MNACLREIAVHEGFFAAIIIPVNPGIGFVFHIEQVVHHQADASLLYASRAKGII